MKRFFGNSSDRHKDTATEEVEKISEELVPIVTLLSAQSHRRYHEGVVLILHDLKSDGTQAERRWREVYAVLIGSQLALWNARELSADEKTADFRRFVSKPTYINFTDANIMPVEAVKAVIQNSGAKKLENMLVVSTTLKNRYFLQFGSKEAFDKWSAAIRLSLYENKSLHQAYTGAFLSSRGARLSDIKVLLAHTKYDYGDWVSVRFGAGMPWKRCYAVISQQGPKKNSTGRIQFYENEKKAKKGHEIAVLTAANAIYAVYPSSPQLIDESTIIKVEGVMRFEKEDASLDTNIFIMPERHASVPGYDTIIRFLIPALNAFQLYGRPKRLIANKDDPASLLFALPTLPHIYYLEVNDILGLASSSTSLQWTSRDWREHINNILLNKCAKGYSGCGSSNELKQTIDSPALASGELFESTGSILSPGINAFSPVVNGPPVHAFSPISSPALKSAAGSAQRFVSNPQDNKGVEVKASAGLDTSQLSKEQIPSIAQPHHNKHKVNITLQLDQSNFDKFEQLEKKVPYSNEDLIIENEERGNYYEEKKTPYDQESDSDIEFAPLHPEPDSNDLEESEKFQDKAPVQDMDEDIILNNELDPNKIPERSETTLSSLYGYYDSGLIDEVTGAEGARKSERRIKYLQRKLNAMSLGKDIHQSIMDYASDENSNDNNNRGSNGSNNYDDNGDNDVNDDDVDVFDPDFVEQQNMMQTDNSFVNEAPSTNEQSGGGGGGYYNPYLDKGRINIPLQQQSSGGSDDNGENRGGNDQNFREPEHHQNEAMDMNLPPQSNPVGGHPPHANRPQMNMQQGQRQYYPPHQQPQQPHHRAPYPINQMNMNMYPPQQQQPYNPNQRNNRAPPMGQMNQRHPQPYPTGAGYPRQPYPQQQQQQQPYMPNNRMVPPEAQQGYQGQYYPQNAPQMPMRGYPPGNMRGPPRINQFNKGMQPGMNPGGYQRPHSPAVRVPAPMQTQMGGNPVGGGYGNMPPSRRPVPMNMGPMYRGPNPMNRAPSPMQDYRPKKPGYAQFVPNTQITNNPYAK